MLIAALPPTKGHSLMSLPSKWRRGLRPDPKVLDLAERLFAAAQRGEIRILVVVTANPMLQIEDEQAGDLDNVRKHLLIGGLASASQKLLQLDLPE